MPKNNPRSDAGKLMTILFIGILIGFLAGFYIQQHQASNIFSPTSFSASPPTGSYQTKINLVAVDDKGNGVAIPLSVEVRPGTGQVLTNIDKLIFWADTQQSIQTAKKIAEEKTGISADNYDLIYTIESPNTTIVGGPSAGAAMTLATISALEHKPLASNVLITGTINDDGTIGQVGAVLQKAQAAKEIGTTTFLVPSGESIESYIIPVENCTRQLGFDYCITTYNQKTVNIGNDVGIKVLEVGSIDQAMSYFFQ